VGRNLQQKKSLYMARVCVIKLSLNVHVPCMKQIVSNTDPSLNCMIYLMYQNSETGVIYNIFSQLLWRTSKGYFVHFRQFTADKNASITVKQNKTKKHTTYNNPMFANQNNIFFSRFSMWKKEKAESSQNREPKTVLSHNTISNLQTCDVRYHKTKQKNKTKQ